MFRYSFLLHSTKLAMTSKLVFILLLAVLGAQAARIEPKPEPEDLRDVALKIIQILEIIGEQVKTGIELARPIILELEKLLSPELAEIVHRLLQKAEDLYTRIVARLKELEAAVTNSIDAINKEAKTCVDKIDVALDKFLAIAETEIAKQYGNIVDGHRVAIEDIMTQTNQTVGNMNAATDKAMAQGVACVKKGSTTVKPCMDDNSDEWNAAVVEAVTNLLLIFNQLLELAPQIVQEALAALQPIAQKLKADADPSWVEFGDCVAKLS